MKKETKYYFEHDEEEYLAPWEGDILYREEVANRFLIIGALKQHIGDPSQYQIGVWMYDILNDRLMSNDVDDLWPLRYPTTLESILDVLRSSFNSCVKFQRRLAEK